MTIKFYIEKKDYLEFLLFSTSKKQLNIKFRKNIRALFSRLFIIFAFIFLLAQYYIVAITCLLIGTIWYFFYPPYIRKKYVQHFSNYIDENLKHNLGTPNTITFNNESIETIDEFSENKYWHKGIEEINEIKNYYFIKVQSNSSFIIPKRFIDDHLEFQTYILYLAEKLNIKYNKELDWQWK
jgi:hypothetical protein